MSNSKNIRIYSFYYKNTVIPVNDELYCPVMAGNALKSNDINIQGDDSGDSISEKNKYFSELTGIYWVWKNTRQDITGSCHYRRYFTAQNEPFDLKIKRALYFPVGLNKKRHGLIYTSNVDRFRPRVLNKNEIEEIFQHYDAILPQSRKLKYTVKKHYSRYHNLADLEVIEQIIRTKHPEYLSSYYEVLNGKRLYANNMFVLPEVHFKSFMQWWFSIIFNFEKQINPESYTGYQQRIIGFLAERLLTVWFTHHKLKVKELPVIYFKKIKFSNVQQK